MGKIYWKNGFYDAPVEGGIEIAAEEWRALLDGQSAGGMIVTGDDGRPVLAPPPAPTAAELVSAEIASLKDQLAATDWAVVKCAELGLSMAEQYPELAAQRTAWRARVNELG